MKLGFNYKLVSTFVQFKELTNILLVGSSRVLHFQLVGYRPFVEACVDAGEKDEALKYIPKLSDPRERAEVTTNHTNMKLTH